MFQSLSLSTVTYSLSAVNPSLFLFSLTVLIDSYQDLLRCFRTHTHTHTQQADVSQPIAVGQGAWGWRGAVTHTHSVYRTESPAICC